jgi:hypothetical protein
MAVFAKFDVVDNNLSALRSDWKAEPHRELRLQFAAIVAVLLTLAGLLQHFG